MSRGSIFIKKDDRYHGVYTHLNGERLGEYLKTLKNKDEIYNLIRVGSYRDFVNNVSYASLSAPTFFYICKSLEEVWINSEKHSYIFIDNDWFEIDKPTDTIVLIKLDPVKGPK